MKQECRNSVTGNGSFTSAAANLLFWLRKIDLQLSVVQVVSLCHSRNKIASENSMKHLSLLPSGLEFTLESPIQHVMQSGNFAGSLNERISGDRC